MFEYACGDSTGCGVMLVLAAVLGALAGLCWLVVTVRAFRASPGQGALCLVVPPYALYYAFARLERRGGRGVLIAGMIAGPLLALLAWNSATAVFGPDVTAGDSGFDAPFPDAPAMAPGDGGSNGPSKSPLDDDLGDFGEPPPPAN